MLHIGIRNKYCAACARNVPKETHHCFKNWDASSSKMESDIILEGFMEAEQVHGVRYTRFIGDGDSSVHSTLLQSVPGWGHAIKKLDVRITAASVTEEHWRSWYRIILHIKVMVAFQ